MCRLIFFISTIIMSLSAERVVNVITEHPEVTYSNPKYVTHVNLTSRRTGRGDRLYYVSWDFNALIYFGNNVSMDFYFYEFLSNMYKRSFVEMHFGFCDLVKKDLFFGSALRQGKFLGPCPYPPGEYQLYNMSIPVQFIPKNFPFKKGRIYLNVTLTTTDEIIANAHIDFEMKIINIGKKSAL